MNRKEKQTEPPKPVDVSYVGATKSPSLVHTTNDQSTSSIPLSLPMGLPIPMEPSPLLGNSIRVSYGPPSIVDSITSSQSSTPIPKLQKQKSHPGVVVNHGILSPVPCNATTHQLEKVRTELQRMQMDLPLLDNGWETHEEVRQRELQEARARAAQMEKTMRWWSDCTANWREKWSKVRNERNKARDENRQLRSKLESMAKDLTMLRRENNELKSKNEHLKTSASAQSLKAVSVADECQKEVVVGESQCLERTSPMESGCYNVRKAHNRHSGDLDSLSSDACTTPDTGENLEMNALQLRLDEAQKTILIEREERAKLSDCMEKMDYELHQLRFKYDDLKRSKQEISDELNRLRDLHDDEVGRMSRDIEDGSSTLSSHQRTLAELRDQVERLQAENAAEWGARERVETEKLALERENKKLKLQICELEDEVSKRKNLVLVESDKKALEQEVHDKNRDWTDLKHAHAKLKKQHAEKLTELEHSKRRADQFDMEVKKLRQRVDELKKDLAKCEDEVDKQTNNSRRVQRNNEELLQQLEHLQNQLDHTQSRLRRASSQTNLLGDAAAVKTFDMMDDSTELSTDADD